MKRARLITIVWVLMLALQVSGQEPNVSQNRFPSVHPDEVRQKSQLVDALLTKSPVMLRIAESGNEQVKSQALAAELPAEPGAQVLRTRGRDRAGLGDRRKQDGGRDLDLCVVGGRELARVGSGTRPHGASRRDPVARAPCARSRGRARPGSARAHPPRRAPRTHSPAQAPPSRSRTPVGAASPSSHRARSPSPLRAGHRSRRAPSQVCPPIPRRLCAGSHKRSERPRSPARE